MTEACRYNRPTADGLGFIGYSVGADVARGSVEAEVLRSLIAVERGHSRRIVNIDGPPIGFVPWLRWVALCCVSVVNEPITILARATIYRGRTEARINMIRETFA